MRSDPAVFALFAVATAGLVAAAVKLCRQRDGSPTTDGAPAIGWPLLLGGGMIVFYVFQFSAPLHVPFTLYFAVSSGVFGVLVVALVRGRWRPLPDWLLFGLGDYMTFCMFSALACVVTDRNPVQAVVAMTILLAGFIYLIRAVMRKPFGRAMPT